MKILVIDDTYANQESARKTLAQHDVTIVGDTVEAQKLLKAKSFEFEVVLTDLLMPLPAAVMGSEREWVHPFGGYGTCVKPEACEGEHPVGMGFALLAALRGAKLVAVVSNLSHHSHPIGAQLDSFDWRSGTSPIQIEGARMMLINEPEMIAIDGGERGKDWGWVLGTLEKPKE